MGGADISRVAIMIYRAMRKHGVNTIAKKLSEIESNATEPNDIQIVNVVIDVVCNSLKCSRKLIVGDTRNAEVSNARKMCYILIKENTRLTPKQISYYFNRTDRSVYRALDEYKLMTEQVKWQKDFIQKKRFLQSLVIDALQNNKIQ